MGSSPLTPAKPAMALKAADEMWALRISAPCIFPEIWLGDLLRDIGEHPFRNMRGREAVRFALEH
jgi:hypothetical protein